MMVRAHKIISGYNVECTEEDINHARKGIANILFYYNNATADIEEHLKIRQTIFNEIVGKTEK